MLKVRELWKLPQAFLCSWWQSIRVSSMPSLTFDLFWSNRRSNGPPPSSSHSNDGNRKLMAIDLNLLTTFNCFYRKLIQSISFHRFRWNHVIVSPLRSADCRLAAQSRVEVLLPTEGLRFLAVPGKWKIQAWGEGKRFYRKNVYKPIAPRLFMASNALAGAH